MSDISAKTCGFGIGEAGRVAESTPADEIEAFLLQPVHENRMVECSCGHTIPASLVMRASRGTSCPDCYEDLSD